MVETSFSDRQFDYFRTSDGQLWAVPRDLAREAASARFLRQMYWIRLWNRALLYGVVAFSSADVVFLALLILFGGER